MQAVLAAAEAEVRFARLAVQRARIVAPVSARAGRPAVHPGSLVQPSGQAPLVTLVPFDTLAVDFSVPEMHLQALLAASAAHQVRIRLEGHREAPEGKLLAIGNTVNPATGTIDVRAEFPNPHRKLWPGTFVRVNMEAGLQRDVVVLPADTVLEGPAGRFVFVVRDDAQVRQVPVKLARLQDRMAVVVGRRPARRKKRRDKSRAGDAMKLARQCIARPIATLLFWTSVVVAGFACWTQLPIAALPRYEAPTIQVSTKLPGASPENIASSVATPLEKQFSAIAGLRMTTSSNIQGQSVITLEFDPSRSIDAAAADVQAALFRAARALPPELPAPPSYKKINPADAPVLLIGMPSPTLPLSSLNAYSDQLVVPALSSIKGVAEVYVTGQKRYAVRIEADPRRLAGASLTLSDLAAALQKANSNVPLGQLDNARQMLTVQVKGGLMKAADFERVVVARQGDSVIRVGDLAQVRDSIENVQNTSTVDGVS